MKKVILWDNDGVLVDTEPLYFRANYEVLAQLGVRVTEADYIDVSLRQGRSMFELALRQGYREDELAPYRKQRDDLYMHFLQTHDCSVPGALPTVQALAPDFRMGVVTSARREHFEQVHRRTGILPFMAFTLALGEYPRSKPHPDPYLAGVTAAGEPASACVVVEDTERGLAAATAAGLPCIAVRTKLTRDCAFAGAAHVVDSITEVTHDMIQRLG